VIQKQKKRIDILLQNKTFSCQRKTCKMCLKLRWLVSFQIFCLKFRSNQIICLESKIKVMYTTFQMLIKEISGTCFYC